VQGGFIFAEKSELDTSIAEARGSLNADEE